MGLSIFDYKSYTPIILVPKWISNRINNPQPPPFTKVFYGGMAQQPLPSLSTISLSLRREDSNGTVSIPKIMKNVMEGEKVHLSKEWPTGFRSP